MKITDGGMYYYYNVSSSSVIPFSSPLLLTLTPDLNYEIGCAEFCISVPPIDDGDACCPFALVSNSGACLLANNTDCLEHNGGV